MIYSYKNYILNEQNEILNHSFNINMKDFDDLIDYLRYEYKNLPEDVLNSYLDGRKTLLYNILKTNFSFDKDGVLVGIENFPEKIKLYRIVELENDDKINTECLGRYWCYDKKHLKSEEFQNSVGFDEKKKWVVIEATFQKDNISVDETIEMLIRNIAEREIRLKDKCIKPIEYKITKYEDFK